MVIGGVSVPWTLNYGLLAQVLLAAGAYLAYVGPLRRRLAGPDLLWVYPVSLRQVACFLGGLFTILLFEETPLAELAARYSFAAHMAQHLVFTLVTPVLLLLGIPPWVVRRLTSRLYRLLGRPAWLKGLLRVVLHPLVGFGLFSAGLVFWHIPRYYGLVHENGFYHQLEHVTFLGTALLAWWPILAPLPELRLPWLLRLGYLFFLGIIPGVIGAFITFSDRLIYAYYGTTPKPFGLDPLTDQLIGGLLMKVVGSIPVWAVATVDFFVTFDREEKGVPEL